MSTDINLYKITNIENLKEELIKEYDEFNINSKYFQDTDTALTFYYYTKKINIVSKWSWIAKKFDAPIDKYPLNPKAVLLIEKNNENYAISFGYSYQLVGKFADKNWPLDFAEHMDYSSIKSVGILSPHSLINRKIYNYFNYDYLDAESGEAFNNIIARLKLDETTSEYLSDFIIIGNSIKFKIKIDNLMSIIKLIEFIEEIMQTEPQRELPKLKKIDDKTKLEKLNNNLLKSIKKDINEEKEKPSINISEFTVDGSNYIFYNSYYDDFGFELANKRDIVNNLDVKLIYDFIKENELINENNLLDLNITMRRKEDINSTNLKKIIMYSDDESIFNEGEWYEYNKLFFEHIHNSLEGIPVYYNKKYDFLTKKKFDKEREKLKEKLNIKIGDNKFEFFFNNYVSDDNENWECFDTQTNIIDKNKFEPTDILDKNNETMYAVKVGNTTGKLSYVVDQSLYALKLLDDGEVSFFDKSDVKNVGIWIVFTRGEDKIKLEDEKLDWKSLKFLIFKCKLADWKRQVLLSGRNPVININYRFKPPEKKKS